MIDTIVLRVHDLKYHSDLVNFVNINFKGTSKNTLEIDREEAEEVRKYTRDDKLMIDYFRNTKTGTHLVRYKSQEKLNNSGHYYFNAFENRDRDFIEFNFSIPKYVYGTNVYMYTENPWEKNYAHYKNRYLEYNFEIAYDRLLDFLSYFFESEFGPDVRIHPGLVEINRIDFCYNQVFRDKKSALEYLKYQKEIVRKGTRDGSNSSRDWDTSLMYVTGRYSLKIYHKGSEFQKNDHKELKKVNSLYNKVLFQIDELQAFADRILRYEITFRNSQLSYIYNNQIFRRRCTIHINEYKVYKAVESINLKNDKIAGKISKIELESSKEKYLEKNPYLSIDKDSRNTHKRISKLLNRQRLFMIKITKEASQFNNTSGTYPHFISEAKFSKILFMKCAKFFIDFVKEYQVDELPSVSAVKHKIELYNEMHYHRLPVNEMLKFYTILMKSSFPEIKKSGLYSKASFYRYKSRFKKIGVTEQNLIPFASINVSADLMEYHNTLITNPKLRPLQSCQPSMINKNKFH